jgi:hypothetical protein
MRGGLRLVSMVIAAFIGAFVGAAFVKHDNASFAGVSLPPTADGRNTVAQRSAGQSAQEVRTTSTKQSANEGEPANETADDSAAPGASDALETLDTSVLKERIIDVFPDGYLTIVAIIQGAAFGLLFITAQKQFSGHIGFLHSVVVVLETLATAIAIMIVTHQYILLTMMVRWTPTFLDTLVPYFLGFGEIWLSSTVGSSATWWLGMAWLCAAAIFAFWHTSARTPASTFGKFRDLATGHHNSLIDQIRCCALLLACSIAAAFLNFYKIMPTPVNIALVCGVAAASMVVELLGEYDQHKIYDKFEIPRWKSSADSGVS